MKKKYKILLYIWAVELFIASILNKNNFEVQSWIGNAIGVIIAFLPIQMLLFLLGKDEDRTPGERMLFKLVFWFINICYVLGAIASLVDTLYKPN